MNWIRAWLGTLLAILNPHRALLKPTVWLLCGILSVNAGCVSASTNQVTRSLSLQPAIERPLLQLPSPKPPPARAVKSGIPTRRLSQLPPEAKTTVGQIYQGGPFPYERDGIEFRNREGLLPKGFAGGMSARSGLVPCGWLRDFISGRSVI